MEKTVELTVEELKSFMETMETDVMINMKIIREPDTGIPPSSGENVPCSGSDPDKPKADTGEEDEDGTEE